MGRAESARRERPSRLELRPHPEARSASPSLAGRLARRVRFTPASGLLWACLALGGLCAAPAEAQDVTLVSNYGSLGSSSYLVGEQGSTTHIRAARFTTGASSQGYVLKSLRFNVGVRDSGTSPKVSIHRSVSDLPGGELYTLGSPSDGTGEKTVFAPVNARLDASTSYFVVFEDTDTSDGDWSVKDGGSTYDTDSLVGWTIDGIRSSVDGGTTWGSLVSSEVLALKLVGEVVGSATPVWSATMTVGETTKGARGISGTSVGSLDDYDFTIEDTDYEVISFFVGPFAGRHQAIFASFRSGGSLESIAKDGYTLEFAGETLPLSASKGGGHFGGQFEFEDAWLAGNAPSLSAANFAARLPLNATVRACLRTETQVCPLDTTATNNFPTVANEIPDQTATKGTAFSYTVPADTFSDADGDTLLYGAAQADTSLLPTWLSFDTATRKLSGTPPDAGTVSVKVTASDGKGGSVSDVFDIVVSAVATVPGAPQSLMAAVVATAAVGHSDVKLTWEAPSDNGGSDITGYQYRYRVEMSSWSLWSTAGDGDATEVTVPGLTNGGEVDFELRAVNDVGAGTDVAEVTVTPDDLPGVPQDLGAETGGSQVTLYWNSGPGGFVKKYEYRHAVGTSVPATVEWVDAGVDVEEYSVEVTVTGLANGTSYAFEVRAVNDAGESTPAGVTATPSTDPVWSTTMTVGAYPTDRRGYDALLNAGMLDDADFTVRGATYTVSELFAGPIGSVHYVSFTLASGGLAFDDYTLEVGGVALPLSAATPGVGNTRLFSQAWLAAYASKLAAAGFETTLAVGARASVCLRTATQACPEGAITLSDDATLSALAVTDNVDAAVTLTPGFDSDTVTYTAAVRSAVRRITFAPTKGNENATVKYFEYDADDDIDIELTGADPDTDALTVDLALGANVIKVVVTAHDGTTTRTYQVTVDRVNEDATGDPTIAGVPQVGQVLTAGEGDIDDDDGLPDTFPDDYMFQWVRVDSGTETDITGETAQTYTPVDADIGKTLKVKVSFDDDGDTLETRVSAATAAVVRAPEDCAIDRPDSDWCATMTVGMATAGGKMFYGYFIPAFAGGAGALDDDILVKEEGFQNYVRAVFVNDTDDVVGVWLTGSVLPGSEFDIGGVSFAAGSGTPMGISTQYAATRPTGFAFLDGQKVTVSANLAPLLLKPTVDGTSLVLPYYEDLDESSVPATSAYTVTVDGTEVTVSGVEISGDEVTLTLGTAAIAGQTVTVSYTVPTSDPVRDESGLDAPGFAAADHRVSNKTGNTDATGKPAIGGVSQVGRTLMAEKGGIADANGLPDNFPDDYLFQWVRVDGVGNETRLSTSRSYPPVAADVGHRLLVEVSFDDDRGTRETLVSDAVPVVAALGVCPASSDWSATLTMGLVTDITALFRADTFGFAAGESFGDLAPATFSHGSTEFTVTDINRIRTTPLGTDTVTLDDLSLLVSGGALPDGTVVSFGGTELTVGTASEHDTVGSEQWDLLDLNLSPTWVGGQELRVCANLPPGLVRAVVDGTSMMLTYDQALDESSVPAPGDYTVTVDGTEATVESVAVADSKVTLTLAAAVTLGQTVTVDYDPTTVSDPVRDESGLDAPALDGEPVVTEDKVAPSLTDAEIRSSGTTIILTFDEPLDVDSLPPPGAFMVTVGGDDVEVVSVTAGSLLLELSEEVKQGQPVEVRYEKPTTGDLLRDIAGNEVESFTIGDTPDTEVTNNSTVEWGTLDPEELRVDEGATGSSYTVELTEAPPERVTVTVTGAGMGVSVRPESFELTPSDWEQTVEVTAAEDENTDGEKVTLTHTPTGGGYDGATPLELVVTVKDNDRPPNTAGDLRLVDKDGNVVGTADADAEGNVLGRLEVFHKRKWGTVCDDRFDRSFDFEETTVVNHAPNLSCRLMGYAEGTVISAQEHGFTFLRNVGPTHPDYVPIWLDDVRCVEGEMRDPRPVVEGREPPLHRQCWHAGVGLENCGHREDIHLQCSGVLAGSDTEMQVAGEPLTLTFEEVPVSHDGSTSFPIRLAFGDDVDIDAAEMKDHALFVSNAIVTGAAKVDGRSDLWELTLQPTANGGIGIIVPHGRACTDVGALCTEDGRTFSDIVLGIQIPYAPSSAEQGARLTGAFENVPEEHDGETVFTVELAFSEPVFDGTESFDKNDRIQNALQVDGAQVRGRRRVDPAAFDRWIFEIRPSGNGGVTVTLPATEGECGDSGAICTPDDVPLAAAATATIPGPPGLSVADAEVEEGSGATLAFAVTLSRASSSDVSVDYATVNGSAEAGKDYEATSGVLRFQPGDTEKTVSVPILDDSEDEGDETLTLILTDPTGGNAFLADDRATGTIRNSDLMPQAWLARFGRTVAEQVLDAVEGRIRSAPPAGTQVTVAGQRLGGGAAPDAAALEEADAKARLESVSAWLAGETPVHERRSGPRTVAPRELLTGSSFALTAGSDGLGGGLVSLWGRGAVSRFDGREGELSLSGEVTGALLGADWTRERWTAGLMLSRARGEGEYRASSRSEGNRESDSSGSGSGTGGDVTSTVTGLYPYGRYALSERVTVWGAAGYGSGTLTLTPDGGAAFETDMDLAMAAAGLRGVVVEAPAEGGAEVAVKTDALGVRTTSEAVAGSAGAGGNLAAAEADVTRLRLGLEGTWQGLAIGTGTLAPRLEVGVRHDGGDAESGFGLDLGGGLSWSDPGTGLTAQASGRGLLTHEAGGFGERGFAGAFGWDPRPGTERGPSLTVRQALGMSASGGADALLGRATLAGLAANDGGDEFRNRRLEVRFGYGVPAFGGRFTARPEAGLALSEGRREYAVVWRLARERRGSVIGSLELGLEARRRESAGDDTTPEDRVGVRFNMRW